MIPILVGFWGGLPKWLQDVLKFVGIALVLFAFGKAVADSLKAEGAQRERQKQAVDTAKARAELVETSNREIQNVQDAKDAAVAAPHSLPEFGSADELRQQAPAIGRVILPHRGEDQPGS